MMTNPGEGAEHSMLGAPGARKQLRDVETRGHDEGQQAIGRIAGRLGHRLGARQHVESQAFDRAYQSL
jgi:hypothetical protein